jgi:hypothetical protein
MTPVAAKPASRTPSRKRTKGAITIDPARTLNGKSGQTPGAKRGPKGATLQFGSVSLKVATASAEQRQRNVGLGQAALKKFKSKIVKPGVKLRAQKGVPLFFADPTNPRRIVRVLDGKREVGAFENGTFKAAN